MTAPEPRPGLRDVEPYAAPQLDAPVRLNTNECPAPLPEDVAEDLAATIRDIPLHRYPDREAIRLREALGGHTGHPVEGVWAANGSNEVLHQLVLAFGGPGRKVVTFEPTYPMHERISSIGHSEVARIHMDSPFVIAPMHVADALSRHPNVVFVCSPNNPTGNSQPVGSVKEIAASDRRALVIVDEAYIEFGGESAAPLIAANPNIVVVRTFSKAFALAGARIGYCLADPQVIEDLRRVRLPYHLSALTQSAGLVALRHAHQASAILDAVRAERNRIFAELCAMGGVYAFPSDANFVLFRPARPAAEVWQALLDRGVLVRDVSAAVPGCLRVTAGTTHEVDVFLQALAEVLA